MQVNADTTGTATNIPECMRIHELQHKTALDYHLQQLKECITKGWPENKDNRRQQNLRPYWTFQDGMAVTDGVCLKGRHIVIPNTLQKQVLQQLHVNHMGMGKTKLLDCRSIYWPGVKSNFEKYIINSLLLLNFSKCNQRNE